MTPSPSRAAEPLRLLVLTTHPVANTVGGELLLFRHIQRAPRAWHFDLRHLDDRCIRRQRWVGRIRHRTRGLQRIFNAWDAWSGVSIDPASLRQLCRETDPDLLYTVADGPLALRVWQLSRQTGIPFVVQLNDWAPGGLDTSPRLQARLAARYRRMLAESSVNLCFSEEIRRAAGSTPNARVLYPVPELPPPPAAGPIQDHALFAGRFDHFLGPEMLALIRALCAAGQPGRLRIIGPDAHWNPETREAVAGTAIYGGLLKGPAFHAALDTARVLLVLAPFGREREHIAHFSFPSKIPEYCHHPRPILVWGPEHSSSVQWARRTGAAVVVATPDPAAVVAALDDLGRDPARAEACIRAARREAETVFHPDTLQGVFEGAVRDAAARRPASRAPRPVPVSA